MLVNICFDFFFHNQNIYILIVTRLFKELFVWRWAGSIRQASSRRWDLTLLEETLIKI